MALSIDLLLDNIGPILLASSFLFFSLLFVGYYRLYNNSTVQIPGKIVGIEKYVSKSRSGNRRSSQLMYRPVVSFIYHGEKTYFTAGLSKNFISEQIGDNVSVEYIDSLISSVCSFLALAPSHRPCRGICSCYDYRYPLPSTGFYLNTLLTCLNATAVSPR